MLRRALDLFSGVGGWSLACHAHGIETAAACEIDEWKRAQYAAHFPAVKLYRDVCALTGRQLLDDVGPVDIVVGSPPCTDISTANSRGEGVDGDESRLYFEAIRIVRELRECESGPCWLAFENSSNLRARGSDRVLAAMEEAGYTPWPLVVGAVHVGAPHLRRRSWLVAADTDRFGLRKLSGRRPRARRSDGQAVAPIDADTDSQGQSDRAKHAEVGRRKSAASALARGKHVRDPDRESLAIGEGFSSYSCQELTASERATHGGWRDRSASLARHLRMDDGISSGMAAADARAWGATLARARSAYGDAIVPQVGAAVLAGIIAADRWLRTAA